MHAIDDSLRERIASIVKNKFGRIEEDLLASGLLDSMQAVQLALILEKEFSLPLDTFDLKDMSTLSSLVEKISTTRLATREHTNSQARVKE